MNITNKLKAIQKARKRRVALFFHTREVGGIDVPNEQFNDVLAFVKLLFKVLKAKKFNIEVNHWGEILLTEPRRQIRVLLSIKSAPHPELVDDIRNRLSVCDYFQQDAPFNMTLELSFKAHRRGTKWRSMPFPVEQGSYEDVATKFVMFMIDKVSGLSSPTNKDYYQTFLDVEAEDILCVINYGASLHGEDSQFAFLLQDDEFGLFPTVQLDGDRLRVSRRVGSDRELLLNKQSLKLMNKFFF